MIKKICLFICMLFFEYSYSMHVATVSLKNDEVFIIKNNVEEVGRFEILLQNDGKVFRDGNGIKFKIKIKTMMAYNLGKTSLLLYYNDTLLKNSELKLNMGNNESEEIYICINDPSIIKNKPFDVTLRLSLENFNVHFIDLTITPEFSFSVENNIINLGTLVYDNNMVTGQEQSIAIEYGILKSARCKILSKNNFCIKHRETGYPIKYDISSDTLTGIDDSEKEITLNKNNTAHRMQLSVNCYCREIPTAGDYEDNITLTIIPDE